MKSPTAILKNTNYTAYNNGSYYTDCDLHMKTNERKREFLDNTSNPIYVTLMISEDLSIQRDKEFLDTLCERLNTGTVYLHIGNVLGHEPLYNRIHMLDGIFDFIGKNTTVCINSYSYDTETKIVAGNEIDNTKVEEYIELHKRLKESKILCKDFYVSIEVNTYNSNGVVKDRKLKI